MDASARLTLGAFDFRNNGIGFLRIFLAVAVVWSHAYSITGMGVDPIARFSRGAESGGSLAVDAFFVLSGFLIARSYESIGNLARYLWHRALRIFPGFWVCLAVTAFAIVPIAYWHDHHRLAGFWSQSPSPAGYVFKNLGLILNQETIGEIFDGLPERGGINGSLWSLMPEFLCYLLVGLLGFSGLFAKKAGRILAPLLALACWGAMAAPSGDASVFGPARFWEPLAFFFVGSAAYLYRGIVPIRGALAVAAVAIACVLLPGRLAAIAIVPCASYAILYAAMKLGPKSFDRHADLSYGCYVYAFPLQQLLFACGAGAFGLPAYLAITLATIAPVAGASWFLIEKPALSLKSVSWPWPGLSAPARGR